jgi:hypothetical protein
MDQFTQAYIETLFWADCHPDSECADMNVSDMADETLASIKADCEAFQKLAKRSLDLAYNYATLDYNEASAGHDFWLTRQGHGAGFWDRGLGAVGEQLTKDAKSFGECWPYKGDDGKLYI